MLYIIPTPIGNLEDISFRAVRLLGEVDLILAEDTRTSKKLLSHYNIDTPIRSYHIHNEHRITANLVQQLQTGTDMALISDAGTPAISDPGFLLVRACIEAGVGVSCLPGATAFVPALVNSGIPCDKFHFEAFLPHKKGRQTRLKYLADLSETFVLYESPHRLVKCLKQLIDFCGADRMASVSRELTKIHEENIVAPLEELVAHFEKQKVKGEIVIVVAGKA